MTLFRESTPAPVVDRIRASFTSRDASVASAARARYMILQRSLAALNKADARVMLGCDTGLEDHLFGYAEQRELAEMVAAGMSPAQVIVAATSRSVSTETPSASGTTTTSAPAARCSLIK